MKRRRGEELSGKVARGSAEHKIERRRYLSELVEEFNDSESTLQAKQQILANLANFGYDPYNFEFFNELGVIQLFLDQLHIANDSKLIEFSLGGLCNFAPDPVLGRLIILHGGIPLLKKHLSSVSTSTIVSSITSLMFLMKYGNKTEILTPDFISQLNDFVKSNDNRIKNVSVIFLKDFSVYN